MEVSTPNAGPKRSFPWTRPAAIVVGGAALIALARWNPLIPDRGARVLSGNAALALTFAVLLFWFARNAWFSRGTKKIVLGGIAVFLFLLVATMRTEWTGDLWVTPRPRNWVLNILRRMNVNVGDVIHTAQLADPPLVLTPGEGDSPRFLGPTGDGKFPFAGGRLSRDWSQNPP